MTRKNGDLPAMPIYLTEAIIGAAENGADEIVNRVSGLTKREYLAALAMQGLLSNMQWTYDACPEGMLVAEWLSNQSIISADALLKGLENSK